MRNSVLSLSERSNLWRVGVSLPRPGIRLGHSLFRPGYGVLSSPGDKRLVRETGQLS